MVAEDAAAEGGPDTVTTYWNSGTLTLMPLLGNVSVGISPLVLLKQVPPVSSPITAPRWL